MSQESVRSARSQQQLLLLSDRLETSLRFAGISPLQMADRLGTTESAVRSWLLGRSAPRLPHLMMWARHCGVPFDWLSGADAP